MDVTVVGAGVIGLTTAVVFQRAGHDVRVVARERGLAATSGAAGAIWLPIRLPEGSVQAEWAFRTYTVLSEIAARAPEAGVDIITACEVVEGQERPWWADRVEGLERRSLRGIYPFAESTWAFRAPRVEPAVYLPWLEAQLQRPVEAGAIANLDDLDGDRVLNCTGIGARRLCPDPALIPVFGQTVIVEPGGLPLDMMLGDERNPDAIFYSIPRRAEVVLGGCRTPLADDILPPADDVLTRDILERTRAAGFRPGAVLRVRCGLRPVRERPRVEREGRVIHNYGHGGSGFALSWGSAEAALGLASGD